MENWFRNVGRTILSEAIEGACDRINDSFKTEYQVCAETQANLTTELNTLRHKASEVARLREENITLKAEFEALKKANCKSTNNSNTTSRREVNSALRTPLSSKSASRLNSKRLSHADVERLTVPELKAELLYIGQSHAKLRNTCFDLQDALSQSNQLLRERTTSCGQWIEHAEQLREQSLRRAQKIKKLEAKLAELSRDSVNGSLPPDGADVPPPPPIPILSQQHETPDIPTSSSVVDPQDQLRASIRRTSTRRSESPCMTPSLFELDRSTLASEASELERTEDAVPFLPPLPQSRKPAEGETEIKSEPLSDSPVIVSERPVRKRKYVGPDNSHRETLSRIKTEHSPEPRSSNFQERFAPQESIDLDVEGHRVQTPKKQTKYQRSYGAHAGDVVDAPNDGENSRIIYHIDPQGHGTNDGSCRAHITDLTASNRPKSQSNSNNALQPLSNNQVLFQGSRSSHSRIKASSMLSRGIASLAEDNYQSKKENSLNSRSKKTRSASVLAQLLDPQPRAPDSRKPQPRIPEVGQLSDVHSLMPKSRALPTENHGSKSATSPQNDSPTVSSDTSPTPPMDRNHNRGDAVIDTVKEREKKGVPALRQAAKASLRLDDFKINPHANEGYDYAYTDVVRRKNDRACLQGCVKENCCGRKFRGLANACRASTSPSEFVAQLESYLGDNCHRLSTMSAAEKESLWVEAKMKELANTSGKHRHRYPRMPTPPGFWRADFPTTQEGEEYNEEASRLERQLVEERYREAMRPGGLWIFRDE